MLENVGFFVHLTALETVELLVGLYVGKRRALRPSDGVGDRRTLYYLYVRNRRVLVYLTALETIKLPIVYMLESVGFFVYLTASKTIELPIRLYIRKRRVLRLSNGVGDYQTFYRSIC